MFAFPVALWIVLTGAAPCAGPPLGCPAAVSRGLADVQEHALRMVVRAAPDRPGGRSEMIVEVDERIVLAAGHPVLELLLPDTEDDALWWQRGQARAERLGPSPTDEEMRAALEGERRALAGYRPEEWSVSLAEVSVDEHAVRAGHRSELLRDGRREGGFQVAVPASARSVRLRWSFRAASDEGAFAVAGLDLRALSTWGGPPARFSAEWHGFGDLPATALRVKLLEGASSRCRNPWVFRDGVLSIHAERCVPTGVAITLDHPLPSHRAPRPAGASTCTGAQCLDGPSGPCSGDLYFAPGRWAEWLAGAQGVAFDSRSLALARNLPYACCGYVFKTPWLRDYFAAQAWYCPAKEKVPALEPEVEEIIKVLRAMEDRTRAVEEKRLQH